MIKACVDNGYDNCDNGDYNDDSNNKDDYVIIIIK